MLVTRWGTLVVVVAWVASWGLVFVHWVPAVITLVALAAPLLASRAWLWYLKDEADFVYSGQWARDTLPKTYIAFPFTLDAERHNARARLERRIATLAEGKRACQELIETATEEEATRIPVLEAERDAAEREIARLRDDIRRLEAGWEREDRERKYRELVG